MQRLEEKIGYHFRDPALLEQALIHSSYANEKLHDGLRSYERLEFLGDSILNFLTAQTLYHTYAGMKEGELSKLRADLVCEKSLEVTARELSLGDYLLLGKGMELAGGRNAASILADLVEAILAAIYLDGGYEPAERFFRQIVLADFRRHLAASADYKTELQELVQQKRGQALEYHLLGAEGPEHDRKFYVSVTLNDETVGTGEGTSKKRAEQEAAREALQTLYPDALKHMEVFRQ